MSANILLIEYERRNVDEVRAALTGKGHHLEVAGDLNTAVDVCAHFEPKVVIITSALPQTSVGDAITQLRARAGLRVTPFLVLAPSGEAGDASSLGAQDLMVRPFAPEELGKRVEALVEGAAEILTTQAVPQETIDALRKRSAKGTGESFSSDDLFADILSDVEGGGDEKAAVKPPKTQAQADSVDKALADVLTAPKSAPKEPRSSKSSGSEVDALLSETLAGLEIPGAAGGKKKDGAAPAATTPLPGSEAGREPVSTPQTESKPEPVPAPAPAPEVKPPPETEKKPAADQGTPAPPAPKPKVDEPAPPAPSGTTFGQYVLEEHIATGGMAQVYKARMLGLEGFQKTVAVKRILPHLTDNEEFVKMFVDEAKLAAQLNHPNIIHIYDLGKIESSHFIAMEYIEGRDLRSVLDSCRDRGVQVPVPIALHVATVLAGALDYAHKKRDFDHRDLGLVHRDVSPQNVLISTVGEIKLCDFGIAKAASKASHTRAGALKGKLQYMSPEQAWGKDIDHRSDVFSLGLVLYEMLTAHKVFTGDSELSILEQVRNPEVEAPSKLVDGIPAEVDRIALKALSPERTDRYQSALDLARDCEAVLKSQGWEPDTAALVGFIGELTSGAEITTYQAAAVTDETPPAAPPKEKPPSVAAPKKTAEPVVVSDAVPVAVVAKEDEKKGIGAWVWIAAAVVVIALIAGWWFFLGPGSGSDDVSSPGSSQPAVVVLQTPTPQPVVDDGLMDEAELLERAREVASAEMAKQEQELRDRLEKEFPTPTPLPPTPTPTDTPTETPTPEPTATPVPPTPTRVPTATPIPMTPTPAVREGDIVEPGPGVIAPVLLHRVDPEYPAIAQRAGIGGEVVAQILVGIDGTVEEVRIVEVARTGVGFERAVDEAVRQWRYRPATKNGVKVRTWVRITINMSLN